MRVLCPSYQASHAHTAAAALQAAGRQYMSSPDIGKQMLSLAKGDFSVKQMSPSQDPCRSGIHGVLRASELLATITVSSCQRFVQYLQDCFAA